MLTPRQIIPAVFPLLLMLPAGAATGIEHADTMTANSAVHVEHWRPAATAQAEPQSESPLGINTLLCVALGLLAFSASQRQPEKFSA